MFVTLVFHHVVPEHLDDFARLMSDIEEGMAGTEGLLTIESYQDPASGDLVALGRWESAAHAQSGIPRLISIGSRQDHWTSRPDDIFMLPRI